MSEKNMPQNQNENRISAENTEDTEHTKEFKLGSEDFGQTKEFKIEKKDSALADQGEENREITGNEEAVASKDFSAEEKSEQPETSVEADVADTADYTETEQDEEIKSEKKRTSFKDLPKSAKIAIITAVTVVVISLIIVILVIVLKKDNIENNGILVYRKGSECIIRIDGKELSLGSEQADNFKADKDTKRVYYTIPSAQSEDYYDLYYVQLTKNEITKPALIDNAIENGYGVMDDKVVYLKYNIKTYADDCNICDMESKSITAISSNVNGFYCLGNDEVYFTKPDGENFSLYNYSGETPKEVTRNVTEIQCFSDADKPHIIYQTKTETLNASSLFVAYAGEEPELICDNAYMVAFDYYKPGGNLYYFTDSQESISWSYVISDKYYESDSEIKKPVLSGFGNSNSYSDYQETLLAYVEKTARDKIRAALDETAVNGGLEAPVFTAFAYNGKTVKLVEGIDPSRVYSYASFGEPKIVYEKTTIKQGTTDVATLGEMAKRSGIDEAIAYAKSLVTECVEAQGMAVAVNSSNGALSFDLKEYDKGRTVFRFSEEGNSLFAVVSDIQGGKYSLYCNTFGKSGVSTGVPVSANIKSNSVAVNGESVVYIIADIGKETGDVFSFSNGTNSKISNSASEFFVDKSKNVFVIKNALPYEESIKGDFYTQFNGSETQIGSDVLLPSFISREDGASAFVQEDANGDSKLMIYFNGETTEVCAGATQLLLYM